MSKSSSGILVESDVLAEYLTASPSAQAPLLRRLLELEPCYTTFIQAADLYASAAEGDETRAVERVLFGLKILGASSRYAKTIGGVLSSLDMHGHRAATVAAIAIESSLPIVTDMFYDQYAVIPALRIVQASELRAESDPEALRALLAGPVR